MPNVFSRVGLDGDDASSEQLISGHVYGREFSVINARSSRAEDDKVSDWVISDGGPHIAAADLPRVFAMPCLRGHFERLRFNALGGIAGDCPESPRRFAGFRVVGDQRSANAVVGSVVAH